MISKKGTAFKNINIYIYFLLTFSFTHHTLSMSLCLYYCVNICETKKNGHDNLMIYFALFHLHEHSCGKHCEKKWDTKETVKKAFCSQVTNPSWNNELCLNSVFINKMYQMFKCPVYMRQRRSTKLLCCPLLFKCNIWLKSTGYLYL